MDRFIRVLQKDIVTDPEQWKYAGPGKFVTLSDRAKNVYVVLSVIAYSTAGNSKDMVVQGGQKLGSDWFWTSHALLQQLTGSCQKTVQRGIQELQEEGFIKYYPAKKQGQRCFFKIKRIKYNNSSGKDLETSATKQFNGSTAKQKFTKEDDELILEMNRTGKCSKLTPAQEWRLVELQTQGMKKKINSPHLTLPDDDDIPF